MLISFLVWFGVFSLLVNLLIVFLLLLESTLLEETAHHAGWTTNACVRRLAFVLPVYLGEWWRIEVDATNLLGVLWLVDLAFLSTESSSSFTHLVDLLLIEALSFFAVFLGFFQDLFLAGEFVIFVVLEVVSSEQLASSQPYFSFGPFPEMLLSDLFVISCTELNDTLNKLVILFMAPVVSFLDIKVFEV